MNCVAQLEGRVARLNLDLDVANGIIDGLFTQEQVNAEYERAYQEGIMSVDDLSVPLAIAERDLAQAEANLAAKQAELDAATAAYGVSLAEKDNLIAAGVAALVAARNLAAAEVSGYQAALEFANSLLQAEQTRAASLEANVATLQSEIDNLNALISDYRTTADAAFNAFVAAGVTPVTTYADAIEELTSLVREGYVLASNLDIYAEQEQAAINALAEIGGYDAVASIANGDSLTDLLPSVLRGISNRK